MLLIQGLSVVLLVQGRGDIADMTAVTAVLLHHSVIDKEAEC